jgi:ribose transport system permease protein
MNAELTKAKSTANKVKIPKMNGRMKRYLPSIVASIILLMIGQILSHGFASVHNIANILTVASILAIAVIAQTLVILAGGEGIDLSVGAVMSMGALLGPMLTGGESSHLPLAILGLAIIGGITGLINGIGIQWFKIPPLLMTLIMVSVINGFTLAYTKGQPASSLPQMLLNINKPFIGPVTWLTVITILLFVLGGFLLKQSRYGRALYVTGSNRRAAEICGIHVNLVVVMTYVISGIVGILAGLVLVGYTGSAQLEMASDYTLLSVAAVVIGGTKLKGGEGSLVGGALGSIVLVMLTSVLVAVGMPAGVRQLIQGLALLVILILYSRSPKLRQ